MRNFPSSIDASLVAQHKKRFAYSVSDPENACSHSETDLMCVAQKAIVRALDAVAGQVAKITNSGRVHKTRQGFEALHRTASASRSYQSLYSKTPLLAVFFFL